jgi:hypothetical protein
LNPKPYTPNPEPKPKALDPRLFTLNPITICKTEVGFLGGLAFSTVGFPLRFLSVFLHVFFLPYGDFDWFKTMTRPKLALKNETAIISSGNHNAKSSFWNRKTPVFSQSQFCK